MLTAQFPTRPLVPMLELNVGESKQIISVQKRECEFGKRRGDGCLSALYKRENVRKIDGPSKMQANEPTSHYCTAGSPIILLLLL